MKSIYDTVFNRQWIYGSPLAVTSLNGKKIPVNPKIETPAIVRRAGGAIKGWEPGNKNADLLEGVTE